MGFDGNPNAQSSCNKFRHIIINKIKKEEEVNEERESEITRRGGVVVLVVGRGAGWRRVHVGTGLTHPGI